MEIARNFVEIDQVDVDIEISKAFDRVDHGISIRKLSNLRIHGKPLNWFVMYSDAKGHIQYAKGREMRVRVEKY